MPSSWITRPVFISSTFRDMQAERDCLRNFVFPELEERLRARRHFLEPIDLRLGVEASDAADEAAREIRVLKVCLNEIQRSRPFLIVLLGDRYGWVPSSERAQAAAREAGFDIDVRNKSVTALEIEFGILKENAAQRHRSFFYFREPLPYETMGARAADYSEAHAGDPEAQQRADRLAALKTKIRNDPELGPRVRPYRGEWNAEEGKVTGLKELRHLVLEDLWNELDAETAAFAAQEPPSWEELHILLRYEIEKDLLNDRYHVKDLPAIWNDRMRDYLGLTPSNALQGVLQDPHWSDSFFGYFPTYALGNLYAAQLDRAVRRDIPDLDEQISRGEFLALREWQREKVHRQGKRYLPAELIERATGEAPSGQAFVEYVETKFVRRVNR